MSETNDDEPQGPAEAPTSPPIAAGDDPAGSRTHPRDEDAADSDDADEAALDLADLDALGVDGVVAQLRGDPPEELSESRRSRPRRSPAISAVVVAFGVYLLVSMWGDFRYWLRSSEPVELGHVSELLRDGRTLDAYDNHYVVLEGTPDVQNATRLSTKDNFVGYRRLTESGGSLFAALPRSKDEPVTNNFQGRFVGRLRRLSEDRAYSFLAQFYANERVTRAVELAVAQLPTALGTGQLPTTEGSSIEVGPGEDLRLVFAGPDATVQLGKSSYADELAAERAVAALGYPYVQQAPATTFFRFVVRIPEAERSSAQDRLNAELAGLEQNTDPKIGALVLGRLSAYGAKTGDVRLDGDVLDFAYGDNTLGAGYQVQDGQLIERPVSERLRLAVRDLTAARLERVIEVDPDGFVILGGEVPADSWMLAIGWLVALGLTLANVASLGLWWRHSRA